MPGQIAPGGIRPKIRNHVFELAFAVGYFLVGLNYTLDSASGERSPIGKTLHPYDHVWSVMYLAAAPLIMYGIFKEVQRFRVAGLSLLGTGTLMQFIAYVAIAPLEPRDFFPLCISLACFIRGLLAAETVKPVITSHIPWHRDRLREPRG